MSKTIWRRRLTRLVPAFVMLLAGCSSASVIYDLPRAGQVSLAVYDNQGRQVRTLLAGEPQTAGKHTVNWDGLDRAGHPMPVGTYTWKLLMNNGLEADYLSLIGQNPIDPAQPWEPTVGSHQGPSSVALGHGGTLYHGSRCSEGPPLVMKLASEQGPVLWTRDWQTTGPINMVELGSNLFILGCNAKLQRVDAVTGRDQGAPMELLWPGTARRPGGDDPVASYGMALAADGENLVIAWRDHDTLRWINPGNGAVVREVALARPKAVTAGDGGLVYILSDTHVVALAPDGKATTLIGDGTLGAPTTLAYDRASRQILVADGGADQRIRRFGLDGKPVTAYGRLGGRRDGAYEPKDFRDVSHLTCDGAGGFYAVESDHVRRIVHIAADGSVAKQWFGGAPFFMVASVDKAKPSEVWYTASYTTMAMVDLDLKTGAWAVTHTYSMPEKGFGDGLFPYVTRFPSWRVRHRAGTTYLIHQSPAAILRVDETGRRLVPVALASHKQSGATNYPSAAINAAMAKQGLNYDDLGSDAFTWSDTNGNGELDPDEFRFFNVAAPVNAGRYCAFDDDFNIYIGFFEATNYAYTGKRWMLFDFQGSAYAKLPNLAAHGSAVPLWDWSRLERSVAKVPPDVHGTAVHVLRDPQGGVTLALKGENEDRHGLVWPDGQSGTAHLLRALPDGTVWTVSKHDSPGRPPATVFRCPVYLPAATHGCIIASDRNHYGATAWTEDGLYAGFFLDRHANDLPAWAYEPWGRGMYGLLAGDDWECAGSITDLPDGSVLWLPRSSGRSAVFRVRGWEHWFRDSGKIELRQIPPAAMPDGSGLAAAYYRGADFAGASVTNQVDARLWFENAPASPRIASWAAGPCAGIAANEPFSVRWTGRLVAPLSEEFWFRIYNERNTAGFFATQWWKDGAGYASVWLNGVRVIDRSAAAPQVPDAHRGEGYFEAGPIRMEAGRSYDLKVEYSSPGLPKPEFALSWASNTKEWERIPPAYLHPDTASATGPVVRVAARGLSGATDEIVFRVASPPREALRIRYWTMGGDYEMHRAEAVIAPGTTTAVAVVTAANGPMKLTLDPDAAYRGDGTAGTVTVGRIPSVTNGLVAAYLLDEAQGRIIHDSVGGRDGAFERFMNPPTPRWLPAGGEFGGSMGFAEPGVQARLPGVNVAGDFTVAFWVRTRKATQPLLLGSLDLWLQEGMPQLVLGGWPLAAQAGARLDDGQWHHLAVVWDQSGGKRAMSLLVDGVRRGTATGPEAAGIAEIALGRSNRCRPGSEGSGFIGAFDDIRIYARCLAEDEVTALSRPASKQME